MTPPGRPAEAVARTPESMPPSPGLAMQRSEVRRFIAVLSGAALMFGLLELAAGLGLGSLRASAGGVLWLAFSAWLALVERPSLARRSAASVAGHVAVAMVTIIGVGTLLQPSAAFAAAIALLIPVALAMPYLADGALRRLMLVGWVAIACVGLADFLPDDPTLPPEVLRPLSLSGVVLASGLLLLLLYRSSVRLKASGREFRRLLQLSSNLAETTEPAVLGELVARHLTEAIGFDDCVIYALASGTGQFAPFGSYPSERSLEASPEALAQRPILGRVIDERARIIISLAGEPSEPAEEARLRTLGRDVMLLLPLVAMSEPVGVAELTASGRRPLDERRLALARTLAFEAGMAIENGRLYHELRHRALHDGLTGLANRGLFYDRVEHALARLARREPAFVGVLFIDLDNFKVVNDTLGHARGDRLLALVAERLRAVVRPADTVARLGGDEFAILLEDLASNEEALTIAERAVEAVAAPFDLAGQPARVAVSIGVSLRSVDDVTVDDLVHEADAAMYAAKRAGKGQAVRFQRTDGRPTEDIGAAEPLGASPADLRGTAARAPAGSVVEPPPGGRS